MPKTDNPYQFQYIARGRYLVYRNRYRIGEIIGGNRKWLALDVHRASVGYHTTRQQAANALKRGY
jgi:hypothetical protein